MKKKCSQFISAVVKIGSGPLQLKTLYTGIQAYYIIKYIKTHNNIVKVIQKRIKQPTGIYFTAKANQIEGENTPSRLK